MPSSAVHSFTDPDDYAGAIRGTKAELTVTRRGRFTAKLIRIDLHGLLAQRYVENLPRILHSANMTGRAMISFRTEPGPRLLAGGLEVHSSTIIQHGEAHHYFQQSCGSAFFGTISLPVEEMASFGAAIAGCDLTPPDDALTLTPPQTAMAKLQRLHAAAGQLAEDAPAIIAHPEAARGLEQALIEAMVECLGTGEISEDRSALRHHAMILRPVSQSRGGKPRSAAIHTGALRGDRGVGPDIAGLLPGAARNEPQAVPDIAPDASRTAGPARQCPNRTTVTEIATRHGFWQFGRFAGEYKSLSGKRPPPRSTARGVATERRINIFRHFCRK